MRVFTTTFVLVFVVTFGHVLSQQRSPLPQQAGRPGVVDPRATPSTKGTAVIRGTVINAVTGRPLRHATVTANGTNNTIVDGVVMTSSMRRTAYTDENGQFECKDLTAGRYQLRASLVGFVTMEFGEDVESAGGQEINLSSNTETFEKADFRLPPGGVISGRVMDDAGEPLEGVQVQALAIQYVGGIDRLTPVPSQGTPNRRTNDTGRYRLFGLPPGEYYVAATPGPFNAIAPPNGDTALGYPITYYPGAADLANAQKVTVSPGQESQADFSVTPSRTFDIAGVVLDFSGRPFGGAPLLLVPGTNGSVALTASQTSRPDGTFRFAGIAPGGYTLQLQPMMQSSSSPSGGPPQPPLFASMPLNVAGNMPDVTVQGRPGRTARFEIVTDSGQPASFKSRDVQVSARPVDFTRSPIMMGWGSQWRTPDDVTAELLNLWGPAVVNVTAPPGWTLKAVRAGGVDMTDKPIDFDRETARLQVVLTDQVTQISGTVTDQGHPVASATVIILASDSSLWDSQSRYLRRVKTNDSGRFTASGLPPAEYRVVALARLKSGTAWQRPDFLEPLVRSGVRVLLNDGGRTSVDLKVLTQER